MKLSNFRLVENGAKIYGVGAIISSLQLQVPLPRKQKDFSKVRVFLIFLYSLSRDVFRLLH